MNKYRLAKFNAASYAHESRDLKDGWEFVTDSNKLGLSKDGFYGITFKNKDTQEVAVAFSGTSFNHPLDGGIWNDFWSGFQIYRGQIPAQYESAKLYTLHSLKMVSDIENPSITLTGHSLGAVLSDLVTYRLKAAGLDNVKAINFDNLGSKPIVEKMLKTYDVDINDVQVNIEQYQSKPHLVNHWYEQVGNVFTVDFEPEGLFNKVLTLASYIDLTGIATTIQQHYFSNMMRHAFDRDTGDFLNPPILDQDYQDFNQCLNSDLTLCSGL